MTDDVLSACLASQKHPLHPMWHVKKKDECDKLSHTIWVPGKSPATNYLLPVATDKSAQDICDEKWEWYGDITEQDSLCAETGVVMHLGIQRVRAVATHDPIAYFVDRSFALRRLAFIVPTNPDPPSHDISSVSARTTTTPLSSTSPPTLPTLPHVSSASVWSITITAGVSVDTTFARGQIFIIHVGFVAEMRRMWQVGRYQCAQEVREMSYSPVL
jgi:hypothetical protein